MIAFLPDQQGEWYGGSITDHEPVPVHPAVPGHHQPGCWGSVCRGCHWGPVCPAPLHRLLSGQHVDGQVSSMMNTILTSVYFSHLKGESLLLITSFSYIQCFTSKTPFQAYCVIGISSLFYMFKLSFGHFSWGLLFSMDPTKIRDFITGIATLTQIITALKPLVVAHVLVFWPV